MNALGAPVAGSRFSIGDLSVSDLAHSKGIANTPPMDLWPNLEALARILDRIYSEIGPFRIESAYRSAELQQALSKVTEQAAARSFHVQAMAADIVPLKEGAESFFARLLVSPLSNELGEIAIKQHTIHLSLGSSYGGKPRTPMRVVGSTYLRLSESEVTDILRRHGYAAVGVAGVVVAAIVTFILIKRLREKGFSPA